jgi:drug/metabolite transporter (DMT)-like permease
MSILIAILGAILYSSKAIFVKLAYRVEPVDSATLLTLRMIFTLPFYALSHFFLRKKEKMTMPKSAVKGAFIAGFLFYVSAILDFEGLKYVSASIERLVLFMYPSLVLLISCFYFKKEIFRYQYIGLALTYLGILLAFIHEAMAFHFESTFLLGVFLVFLCSITYALFVIQNGFHVNSVGAERFTNYTMFFMAICTFIHFSCTKNISQLFDLQAKTYFITLLMAIFATVLPSYMMTYGIKKIGSGNAAIVNSIGPLSTLLQAYFILGKNIGIYQIIGTAFVLSGIFYIGKKRTIDV